ncbi:MAG: hypothetical protein EOM25_12995 [Deltaproteobacteria bacterium]|nr:hypothetical protein [Deltaproteobacteria bacterium]
MAITRTSFQNMTAADSWDVWPLDDATGFMLVVFRNGFSSVVSTLDGPFIWSDESAAITYITGHRPDLPRYLCDPGPR